MSSAQEKARSELIFGLEDRPPLGQTIVGALQHMAAIFIGIITPSIVIAGVLGFDLAMKTYLVSMALLVSGVATFIQCRKFGPIGSGLLSIQGTSFTFLSIIIAIGFSVKAGGGGQKEMMAAIIGTSLVCSATEIIFFKLQDQSVVSKVAIPKGLKIAHIVFDSEPNSSAYAIAANGLCLVLNPNTGSITHQFQILNLLNDANLYPPYGKLTPPRIVNASLQRRNRMAIIINSEDGNLELLSLNLQEQSIENRDKLAFSGTHFIAMARDDQHFYLVPNAHSLRFVHQMTSYNDDDWLRTIPRNQRL